KSCSGLFMGRRSLKPVNFQFWHPASVSGRKSRRTGPSLAPRAGRHRDAHRRGVHRGEDGLVAEWTALRETVRLAGYARSMVRLLVSTFAATFLLLVAAQFVISIDRGIRSARTAEKQPRTLMLSAGSHRDYAAVPTGGLMLDRDSS